MKFNDKSIIIYKSNICVKSHTYKYHYKYYCVLLKYIMQYEYDQIFHTCCWNINGKLIYSIHTFYVLSSCSFPSVKFKKINKIKEDLTSYTKWGTYRREKSPILIEQNISCNEMESLLKLQQIYIVIDECI